MPSGTNFIIQWVFNPLKVLFIAQWVKTHWIIALISFNKSGILPRFMCNCLKITEKMKQQYKIANSKRLKLIQALLFLFLSFSATAQHGTGLVIDPAAYTRSPQMSTHWTGAKYERLPLTINLRPYCPTPGQQGTKPTCVGWAVGYGGLTICRTVQMQLTDRRQIDALAHSAYYVYNKVKNTEGCQSGVSLPPALAFLQQKGDCRAATFGNDTTLCDARPNSQADTEAALFKIKDYARLFETSETPTEKNRLIRQALKDSSPVVVGLYLTRSFYNVADGQKIWTPARDEANLEAHAVVVVGYDMRDETIEIMNSWGEYWGDNGFIKIKFEDFTRQVFYAFRMIADDKPFVQNKAFYKNDTRNLAGRFILNTVQNGQFSEAPTRYNAQRQLYETVKKDWKANETLFQLRVREVPQGKYLYIFSTDAQDKTEIHYPLSIDSRAQFVPSRDAEMVLPAENDALVKSTIGEDVLCILYADYAISDFEKRVKKVALAKGNFNERLQVGFSDILIKNNQIRYDSSAMRFESKATTGSVVPIVLAVEAK